MNFLEELRQELVLMAGLEPAEVTANDPPSSACPQSSTKESGLAGVSPSMHSVSHCLKEWPNLGAPRWLPKKTEGHCTYGGKLSFFEPRVFLKLQTPALGF